MLQPAELKKQEVTLTDRLGKLTKLGFVVEFNVIPEGLISLTTGQVYPPNKIKIINFYHFDDNLDPRYNTVLYALSTASGERGTLIDTYGSSADPLVTEFIHAVERSNK